MNRKLSTIAAITVLTASTVAAGMTVAGTAAAARSLPKIQTWL
jgi:hypothetical protein